MRHLRDGSLASAGSKSAARWIICTMADTPGSSATAGTSKYAKLFMLDEAVGLAAGHRPCWLCRNDRAQVFLERWRRVTGSTGSLDDLDAGLREERAGARLKADVVSLPEGVFVLYDAEPHVVRGDRLHRWTPSGYDGSRPAPGVGQVEVLTPPTTVAVIAAGYEVAVAV